MIHTGPLSEHPYNIHPHPGIRPIYDSFLEDERLVWDPCEYPILGVLKETEKAQLIQLSENLAVWIPKKVIHHTTTKNLLCWLPLRGYHFGGPNNEFFVKL